MGEEEDAEARRAARVMLADEDGTPLAIACLLGPAMHDIVAMMILEDCLTRLKMLLDHLTGKQGR